MALITSSHGFQILENEPSECGCCGLPMPSRSSARGRPRQWCGEDCREYQAALSVLQDKIEAIQKKATTSAWKDKRSELWQLTNCRSATRGTTQAAKAIQVQIVEADNTITVVEPTHKSWNVAWKAVDALTGGRQGRQYCRKAKTRKNGLTHVIRVPRSKVVS